MDLSEIDHEHQGQPFHASAAMNHQGGGGGISGEGIGRNAEANFGTPFARYDCKKDREDLESRSEYDSENNK